MGQFRSPENITMSMSLCENPPNGESRRRPSHQRQQKIWLRKNIYSSPGLLYETDYILRLITMI